MEEAEVGRIWKEYYENLYNIDTREQVAAHIYGFGGVRRGNYFGGEPIGRTKVEVRDGKLKNGKAARKDEVTGEIIKGGGNRVVDGIWRLCNMAFESGVVPENWRSVVIVTLYKDKGKRTECSNYRGINLLSVAVKIYAGILVDRVYKVTEGLINDEQERFKAGRGCVYKTLTLKKIGEKAREKANKRVNREALWWVLRMYDVRGKLLNGINSIYVNSLACGRVKRLIVV